MIERERDSFIYKEGTTVFRRKDMIEFIMSTLRLFILKFKFIWEEGEIFFISFFALLLLIVIIITSPFLNKHEESPALAQLRATLFLQILHVHSSLSLLLCLIVKNLHDTEKWLEGNIIKLPDARRRGGRRRSGATNSCGGAHYTANKWIRIRIDCPIFIGLVFFHGIKNGAFLFCFFSKFFSLYIERH